MKCKYDFTEQEIDDSVCYIPIKELSERIRRNRCLIWRDIDKGHLKAVWHMVLRNGKWNRAYLIHPVDADEYAKKVKGKKRVNWEGK